MDSNDTSYDVIVVGAGPAGLVTATSLAHHGVRTLVVDRHPGTSPFPKATGVSTRTMEIFRGWGLEDRLRAGATPARAGIAVAAGSTRVRGPQVTTVVDCMHHLRLCPPRASRGERTHGPSDRGYHDDAAGEHQMRHVVA